MSFASLFGHRHDAAGTEDASTTNPPDDRQKALLLRRQALKVVSDIEHGTGPISISMRVVDENDNGVKVDTALFRANILKLLRHLAHNPEGRRLLVSLRATGRHVTIVPRRTAKLADLWTEGRTFFLMGSIVYVDPNDLARGADGFFECGQKSGEVLAPAPAMLLGHELIHALHDAQGTSSKNARVYDFEYGNLEERLTIDAPSPAISENSLRTAEHLPLLTGHGATIEGAKHPCYRPHFEEAPPAGSRRSG
jgi:hypothetical protein